MSKLLDRLDRITRGAPSPMGFTNIVAKETIPQMALLAQVKTPRRSDIDALANAQVDAFILAKGTKPLDNTVKPLKSQVWGAIVGGSEVNEIEGYKTKGCDFVVFGIEGTLADNVEEGDTGRILRITPNLPDAILRGLEDLPVDIMLLERPGASDLLSLTHLLAISNIRNFISRYLLLEWDGNLTTRDLEHLRDLGVDGIVLEVAKVGIGAFETMRQGIDEMRKRKPRGEQRPAAILPRTSGLLGAVHHQEEDGDEGDEDM